MFSECILLYILYDKINFLINSKPFAKKIGVQLILLPFKYNIKLRREEKLSNLNKFKSFLM